MEILKFSAPLTNFALTFSLSNETEFNQWYRSRGKTPPKSLELKLDICRDSSPSARNDIEFVDIGEFVKFQKLMRALNINNSPVDSDVFDKALKTRVEVIIRVVENDV